MNERVIILGDTLKITEEGEVAGQMQLSEDGYQEGLLKYYGLKLL